WDITDAWKMRFRSDTSARSARRGDATTARTHRPHSNKDHKDCVIFVVFVIFVPFPWARAVTLLHRVDRFLDRGELTGVEFRGAGVPFAPREDVGSPARERHLLLLLAVLVLDGDAQLRCFEARGGLAVREAVGACVGERGEQ